MQVPTTLLAQVDSSVGGKVGVNLKAGKNLVGAFYQPRLVLCDLDTLASLPMREYRAGLAEVIKYGIIYDAGLFQRLERDLPKLLRRDPRTLAAVVARCCEIKAEVVRQDETESGLRAILNFGHTIGHALEAISHYGKYLHGEAIAIGQVAAARLSARLLGLPARDVERIERLFQRAGLPTQVKLNAPQRQKLLAAMQLDKKVSGGEIKFVLARRIGAVEFGHRVPTALHRASPQPSTLNPQRLAMSAVSETIVREYFELHEFLVRQHRKYISQTRRRGRRRYRLLRAQPPSASTRRRAAVCAQLAGSGLHRARDRGRQRLAYRDLQLRACWRARRRSFASSSPRCFSRPRAPSARMARR